MLNPMKIDDNAKGVLVIETLHNLCTLIKEGMNFIKRGEKKVVYVQVVRLGSCYKTIKYEDLHFSNPLRV